MDPDTRNTVHTVVITRLKDPSKKDKIALSLSRIIKNVPPEKISERLETLPWTLTRKATPKNASRLERFINKIGAETKIDPPLAAPIMAEVQETQILPETHLLSQTQVLSEQDGGTETPVQTEPAPPEQSGGPIEESLPASELVPEKQPVTAPPKESSVPSGPPEGSFPLEPLSLGGILDRTFQICRAHFWKLITVVAIWWGVATLVGILFIIVGAVAGLTAASLGQLPLWLLISVGVILIPVGLIVLIATFYLAQGALIHAVSSIYTGREVRVGASYSFVLGRLRKLALTYILVFVLMFGMVIAAGAAGAAWFAVFRYVTDSGLWAVLVSLPLWLVLACAVIYGMFKLLLVDKVIIIEDLGYMAAIKRSWALISGKAEGQWPRGYFLRLFILLQLFILINIAVSLLFQIPGALMVLLPMPKILAQIVSHILSNVGSVVAGLFASVGMVVFYYDIRNRKEGFDLEMLASIHED